MFSGRPCSAECLSVGWCVANSQFTEPLRYRHLLLFPRNLLPCLLLVSYYLSFSSSVPCFFSFSLHLWLPPPQVLWWTGAKLSLIHKGWIYFAYGVFVTCQREGQNRVLSMHLQLSIEERGGIDRLDNLSLFSFLCFWVSDMNTYLVL